MVAAIMSLRFGTMYFGDEPSLHWHSVTASTSLLVIDFLSDASES